MKGPHERLKYDLRRLWECPVCKRRERTAGSVTFRHCGCQMQKIDGQPVIMQLVADGVQRLVPLIRPPVAKLAEVPRSSAEECDLASPATAPQPPPPEAPPPPA